MKPPVLGWLLVAASVTRCGPRREEQQAIWLADRLGGTVHRLRADLSERAASPTIGFPRVVIGTPDGGAWVAAGTTPEPGDPFVVVRLAPDGSPATVVPRFGWVADLAGAPEGGVWVADRGQGRLLRLDGEGTEEISFPVPGILCVEARADEVLVGDDSGTIVAITQAGVSREEWDLDGQATDLAFAPDGTVRWALDASGAGRILRLAPDGQAFEVATLGFPVEHIAAVRGGVWVASTVAPFVRRYGDGGEMVIEAWLGVPGDPNFLAPLGEGALVPVGGSLVRLDGRGRVVASRGGFAGLAGVSVVTTAEG